MMKNKKQKNKGFTLVELLVSIALFSIILIIVLGTIVTIVDTSRKIRTMTEVMNNLNFTFENITRSVKTAKNIRNVTSKMVELIDQNNFCIQYIFEDNTIKKASTNEPGSDCVGLGNPTKLIADEIKIEDFSLQEVVTKGGDNDFEVANQPRVFVSISGSIETVRGITSKFNLQTTVSQRKLILD